MQHSRSAGHIWLGTPRALKCSRKCFGLLLCLKSLYATLLFYRALSGWKFPRTEIFFLLCYYLVGNFIVPSRFEYTNTLPSFLITLLRGKFFLFYLHIQTAILHSFLDLILTLVLVFLKLNQWVATVKWCWKTPFYVMAGMFLSAAHIVCRVSLAVHSCTRF